MTIKLAFLPVENEDQDSSHSGDAIIAAIDVPGRASPAIVVTDAGFTGTGQEVVDTLRTHFGTGHVDLLISTHPDTDHLNGLQTVIEQCSVDELWLHQPWDHHDAAQQLGNYERIVDLYDAAVARGILVVEPFAGLQRFGGALTVFGPTRQYYEEQLAAALADTGGSLYASAGRIFKAVGTVLQRARLLTYPCETLTDVDDTSARNNLSVVTLLAADQQRVLLTGDAGIGALEQAASRYEQRYGSFAAVPLTVFQAPHHGSHHNVGPTVLDRIVGPVGSAGLKPFAMISSAKSSEKHPSPKVTNALGRRGVRSFATEGRAVTIGMNGTPVDPIPPMQEDD